MHVLRRRVSVLHRVLRGRSVIAHRMPRRPHDGGPVRCRHGGPHRLHGRSGGDHTDTPPEVGLAVGGASPVPSIGGTVLGGTIGGVLNTPAVAWVVIERMT